MPFQLRKQLSRIPALPLLNRLSPRVDRVANAEEREGFLQSQRLAQKALREVASLVREGWTEERAAKLVDAYLRDHGVYSFFHHAFAFFGERSRFDGVGSYQAFSPTQRVLRAGEIYILDVAPIYRGFISDVGMTFCLGDPKKLSPALKLLREIRTALPEWFLSRNVPKIMGELEKTIAEAGFENIQERYPLAVLGHRVHETTTPSSGPSFLNFGWQSYWELFSRGLFGQVLNQDFSGSLEGLWGIEPHIGGKNFGAKFEEILVVEPDRVFWLDEEAGCLPTKSSSSQGPAGA